MNSIPTYSYFPALRSLARKKPFTLLALCVAIVSLVLACITKQTACYDQLGSSSVKIGDKFDPYCASQCDDDAATKKITFINDQQTAAISQIYFVGEDLTPGIKRVVQCGWGRTTGRLFLAFDSLAVVWTCLELLLTAKRKFPFLLNVILMYVIGLGIPLAIFQIGDISYRTCSAITFENGAISDKTFCHRSSFNASFVLNIVLMVLLLAQIFYNIFGRRTMNQKDETLANAHENINLIGNRSRST